jgi:uncharacterized RDD family membrane protein YckC
MTVPAAGLTRRYAAWSLDFTVVAALALLATWSRMQAALHALQDAFSALSTDLGNRLGAAVLHGMSPDALATQLLADPGVHAGADTVQAALLGLCVPPLVAYALLGLLYHVGTGAGPWQASPGQRALGLAVVRADGTRAPLPRLVVRYLASALSWLTLNLGHALALAPPHRTLHDLLSGTAVVQATGDARLPGWAKMWLLLQVLAVVAVTAWGIQRYLALLQAALGAG